MFRRKPRGKKQQQKKKTIIETISEIKATQSNLEKREEHLRRRAETKFKAASEAKKNGNKNQAVKHLKTRKKLLAEAENVQNNFFLLEEQVLNLQGIAQMKTVTGALELARNTAEQLLKNVNADAISELKDDLIEHKSKLDTITCILSEEEIDYELEEQIEQEFSELGEAGESELLLSELPHVPKNVVIRELSEEERLLAELEEMPVTSTTERKPSPLVQKEDDEDVMIKELESLGVALAGNNEHLGVA